MNARKQRALQALLTTNSIKQAAVKAELSERTLYGYLHDDAEFIQQYTDAKSALVDEAAEMLKRNIAPAVETLRQLLDDEKTPAGVRVQACRGILDYSLKLIETNDILKRLEALENPPEQEELLY